MMLHYVASKGAVIAMTKSLSRELGPDDITVNAVAPAPSLSERVAAIENETGPTCSATRSSTENALRSEGSAGLTNASPIDRPTIISTSSLALVSRAATVVFGSDRLGGTPEAAETRRLI